MTTDCRRTWRDGSFSSGISKYGFAWKPDAGGCACCDNAAAAIIDYRTGEVLSYAGSASYTSKGTKKFQPQWDVLSDGWRQPGSSIKPIDYAIGIDDETLTASTMFMDVTTDFGRGFIPTQADHKERGPVRLRSALQFSLNIPAVKAAIINTPEHVIDVGKRFGLVFPAGTRFVRD